MINVLAWVLFIVGVAYLVTASSILAPVRMVVMHFSQFIGSGLYCAGCVSFWVGIFTGVADWSPFYADHPTTAGRIILGGIAALGVGSVYGGLGHGTIAFRVEQGWKQEADAKRAENDDD